MRILITGSRDWPDFSVVRDAMVRAAGKSLEPITIVHGDCPVGADAMADKIARKMGWEIERHPADWANHHRAAGPVRNRKMVALGADVCLAFIMPGSKGAAGCALLAEKAGIPVRRYTP